MLVEQRKERNTMNEKNLITKANQLIYSHYSLNESELKIILTLISSIQPHDRDFEPYEFKITEFIKLLGVQDKSKYSEIPKITEELMKKIIKIRKDNTLLQVAWLSSSLYDKGTGTVTLKVSPELKPYLLGLKEIFTSYRLGNILKLTGKYSIRLYEILKANEYKKAVVIELDELIKMFLLSETYSDFYNLKKRIIEPAQKELEEKTDIMFYYETITARKKVIALKFTIKPNPKNKPKPDQNNEHLALPEPTQKQLTVSSNEPTKEDIETIKTEFQRRYKGELVDKFVKEMPEKKGLAHVQECLRMYKDYIKGQNIRNIGGHFKTFVVEGYAKPVQQNGNKPQRDNFEQRSYTQEYLESFYADLSEPVSQPEEKKPYTYITEEEGNKPTIPYIERKGYI